MRLIDADKFKQQVAAAVARDNLVVEKGNAVCRLIDQQPTAFDVLKVMDQIAEYGRQSSSADYIWGMHEAFGIVKSEMIEGLESDS